MIKKPSELSEKERKIIHWGVFLIILGYCIYYSFVAYEIYLDRGWSFCLEEEDPFIERINTICFNTSKELDEYLESKIYPTNIDYNYINNLSPMLNVS